jgi:hypothetical protein
MARLQRDLNREQIWRRHLDQQQSSGLTVRAYCRANTLRETAFFYWKKEIAKRDREATPSATAATPSAPAFVPVVVIGSPADRNESPIDIRLVEGQRLRVRSGCNLDLLADVLAMLRRSAPEGRPC